MLKKIVIILLIIFNYSLFAAENNDLFSQYLSKVHKISISDEQKYYLVINAIDCEGCVGAYLRKAKDLLKQKKSSSKLILILVYNSNSRPEKLKYFEKYSNVYFDNFSGYNRLSLTPNQSALIIVKNKTIQDVTVLTPDNIKTLDTIIK